MQKYQESPIPLFIIYATVMPNRDIHQVKIVCNDDFEINLPDKVFSSNRFEKERFHQKRVTWLLGREKKNSQCKCGNIMNLDVSLLQCPICRKLSLPSVTKRSFNAKESNYARNILQINTQN